MNRRDFVVKGAAAAAGIAALGAAGDPNAPAPPGDPNVSSPAAGLPPAPAAAARGVSIPPPLARPAYVSRMEAARSLLREVKADLLIETPGSDLRYLTGLELSRSERLIALVLPIESPPVLLGPLLERDRLTGSPAGIEEVVTWEEDEDSFDALRKILKKAGAAEAKVAVGGTTWYDDFAQLNAKLPRLSFLSATAIVGYLRERKSPEEIAFMQAAVEITERAIDASFRETREGMREDELHALIAGKMRAMGAPGEGLVQFGPRSAVPHNATGDRRLQAGDVILVDFGARVNGYWSDISRPAVLGKATGRMKLIHSTIREAQDLALQRAKPDAYCASLDQIARAALGGRGFFKFLLHRLGHGIGLDGHEPPWLTNGNFQKLAVGHVATLEPGVYTPGEYGIRIEDMMEVAPGGGRLLSHPPDALLEL